MPRGRVMPRGRGELGRGVKLNREEEPPAGEGDQSGPGRIRPTGLRFHDLVVFGFHTVHGVAGVDDEIGAGGEFV